MKFNVSITEHLEKTQANMFYLEIISTKKSDEKFLPAF